MSVTKKQVNELENAVVVLEERVEKMEEEHKLLKQMLTMQSTVIDNLQMMMRMMSTSSPVRGFHLMGGDEKHNESQSEEVSNTELESHITKQTSPSINKIKFRMSRVS